MLASRVQLGLRQQEPCKQVALKSMLQQPARQLVPECLQVWCCTAQAQLRVLNAGP